MRLYHFTSFYNLKNVGPENILAVGLKPHRIDWGGVCDDREGVWLTSDPDYATGDAMSAHAEVRITVVIPSTDRRLVRWEKWMRRHCDPDLLRVADETAKKGGFDWREWYVYFVTPNGGRVFGQRMQWATPTHGWAHF
jgi:hypothetical protein